MKKIHTHYDNLKVTKDAPTQVIRAAYKSLSQKYHPDKNYGDPDAIRIMSIINKSYDVLSNPDKRKEHDIWIANQESINQQQTNTQESPREETSPTDYPVKKRKDNWLFTHLLRNWVLYGSLCILMVAVALEDKPESKSNDAIYNSNPSSSVETTSEINDFQDVPAYTKPLFAPNNEPWPLLASYINGYPILRNSGLSSVTIDNSQNDSDVFVKLVSIDDMEAYPIRHFYIPAFDKFTVENVNTGSYDIRYRDLNNGVLARSESFNLVETKTAEGTQFSVYSMTLYKVQNGNMQTYQLSESEF